MSDIPISPRDRVGVRKQEKRLSFIAWWKSARQVRWSCHTIWLPAPACSKHHETSRFQNNKIQLLENMKARLIQRLLDRKECIFFMKWWSGSFECGHFLGPVAILENSNTTFGRNSGNAHAKKMHQIELFKLKVFQSKTRFQVKFR